MTHSLFWICTWCIFHGILLKNSWDLHESDYCDTSIGIAIRSFMKFEDLKVNKKKCEFRSKLMIRLSKLMEFIEMLYR